MGPLDRGTTPNTKPMNRKLIVSILALGVAAVAAHADGLVGNSRFAATAEALRVRDVGVRIDASAVSADASYNFYKADRGGVDFNLGWTGTRDEEGFFDYRANDLSGSVTGFLNACSFARPYVELGGGCEWAKFNGVKERSGYALSRVGSEIFVRQWLINPSVGYKHSFEFDDGAVDYELRVGRFVDKKKRLHADLVAGYSKDEGVETTRFGLALSWR